MALSKGKQFLVLLVLYVLFVTSMHSGLLGFPRKMLDSYNTLAHPVFPGRDSLGQIDLTQHYLALARVVIHGLIFAAIVMAVGSAGQVEGFFAEPLDFCNKPENQDNILCKGARTMGML